MRALRFINKLIHHIMPRDDADKVFDEILKYYADTPDCVFFKSIDGGYHSIRSITIDNGNDIILTELEDE